MKKTYRPLENNVRFCMLVTLSLFSWDKNISIRLLQIFVFSVKCVYIVIDNLKARGGGNGGVLHVFAISSGCQLITPDILQAVPLSN